MVYIVADFLIDSSLAFKNGNKNNFAVERNLKENTKYAVEFRRHSYIHLRIQNCNVNLYFYVHSL